MNFSDQTIQEIHEGSFVVIAGVLFHIVCSCDEDGNFFAVDNEGGEFEFHCDCIDHIHPS